MLKKLLPTVLVIATIVVGITFAAQNPQEISLSYYFNLSWQGPLVFALLGALAAGFILAAVPLWIRAFRLRRTLASNSSPTRGSGKTLK